MFKNMNLDTYIISLILGYLFKYDFKNKEYINYLLVSKKWFNALNQIRCKMCKKGIYTINRSIVYKCNNCWHVLESTSKKKKRKAIYFYSLNNNTKLLSYTNKLKNLL